MADSGYFSVSLFYSYGYAFVLFLDFCPAINLPRFLRANIECAYQRFFMRILFRALPTVLRIKICY